MLPYLQKKLNVPDAHLFTRAACHIFADVLYGSLSTDGFTFRRAALLKTYLDFPALHVYLREGRCCLRRKGSPNGSRLYKPTPIRVDYADRSGGG